MEKATFQRVAITKCSVTLSRGRRYMINPGDISKGILWSPGTPVEIEDSDDPVYRIVIRRGHFEEDELRANPL